MRQTCRDKRKCCVQMYIYGNIHINWNPSKLETGKNRRKITMIELHKTSVFGLTVFR